MAAISQAFRVLVDGADLACAFKSMGVAHEMSEVDNTHLCNSGDRTYLPDLKKSTMNFAGSWDYDETNADKIDNILSSAFAAQRELVVTSSFGAISSGSIAVIADAVQTNYEVNSEMEALIFAGADMTADGGAKHGKWLLDSSADTASINGASLDNTASSANGGVFHAHTWLESDSDATDASYVLQHSTDDSVWADLVASTALGTTHGAVSATVAAGTTVNRYLRVQFTATGGKAYVAAAFYRS